MKQCIYLCKQEQYHLIFIISFIHCVIHNSNLVPKLIRCPESCNILTRMCTICHKPVSHPVPQRLRVHSFPHDLINIAGSLSLSIQQRLFHVLKVFFLHLNKTITFFTLFYANVSLPGIGYPQMAFFLSESCGVRHMQALS